MAASATRRVRVVIVVALVAAAAGVVAGGLVYQLLPRGTECTGPMPATAATVTTGGLVTIVVHPPTGESRTWQVLRADTTNLIEHGLMGVTDPRLGGHHGMLFEFARAVTVSFWMKNTPLPLTVAFFDACGAMQAHTVDMSPCGDSNACPPYGASGPYLWALEVPQGTLPSLGLVTGSRIEVPNP